MSFQQAWDSITKMDFMLGGRMNRRGLGRDFAGVRTGQPATYTYRVPIGREGKDGPLIYGPYNNQLTDSMFVNLGSVGRVGENRGYGDIDLMNYIREIMHHEEGHEAHAQADPNYTGFFPHRGGGSYISDREGNSGWHSFRHRSQSEHEAMKERVAYMMEYLAHPENYRDEMLLDEVQDPNSREQADRRFLHGLKSHTDVGQRFLDRELKKPRLLATQLPSDPWQTNRSTENRINRVFANLENAVVDSVMESGLTQNTFPLSSKRSGVLSYPDRMAGARDRTRAIRRALNRHKKDVVQGNAPLPTSLAQLPESLQQLIGQSEMREALGNSLRARDDGSWKGWGTQTSELLAQDPELFFSTWQSLPREVVDSHGFGRNYSDYGSIKAPYRDLDYHDLPNDEYPGLMNRIRELLGDDQGVHGDGTYYVFAPKGKRSFNQAYLKYDFPTATESAVSELKDWRDDE